MRCYADGLIQLAFAQSAGDRGSTLAGLVTRRAKGEPSVNHDPERPCRHHQENDGDGARRPAHVDPHIPWVPMHSFLLKQPNSGDLRFDECKIREICDHHAFPPRGFFRVLPRTWAPLAYPGPTILD